MILYFTGSPIVAFIYCLTLAFMMHHSTNTHCGVPEFAMSVSEATAVPKSSHYFWTTTILLHVYPRIFQSRLIFNTFHDLLLSNKSITFSYWYSCIYFQWWVILKLDFILILTARFEHLITILISLAVIYLKSF